MNEKYIWKFLFDKAGNAYGVAGLMGNLYAESGLNPENLQNTYNKKLGMTDSEYTAAVDNRTYTNFIHDSAGYGLAQWTYWSRKEKLLTFAYSRQSSIGNLDMQLEFLWTELQSYTGVMNTLKNAKSVREASDAVLLKYERPADQSEAVQKKRAEYGQKYYDAYALAYKGTGGETEVAKKKVIIGSAHIDERGKAKGGQAGDQTGNELGTQAYYVHEKGWRVFRCVDPAAAIKIGDAMEAACANRCIGYDQSERLTLYNAAKPYGFDPSQVQKNVETDCSALVRVCVAYAGITTPNFNTTTEANALLGTGKFKELKGAMYTASSDRLCRGDILCTKTQGHTVVVLTDGPLADRGEEDRGDNVAPADPAAGNNGYLRTEGSYWLRTKPSVVTGKKIEPVPAGALVRVYGEIDGWLGVKVMASGNKGYISGKALPNYIVK